MCGKEVQNKKWIRVRSASMGAMWILNDKWRLFAAAPFRKIHFFSSLFVGNSFCFSPESPKVRMQSRVWLLCEMLIVCYAAHVRPPQQSRRFYYFYYYRCCCCYFGLEIYWFCRRASGDEIHKPVIIHIKREFYCGFASWCISMQFHFTKYSAASDTSDASHTLNDRNTQSPLIGHHWQAFNVLRSRSRSPRPHSPACTVKSWIARSRWTNTKWSMLSHAKVHVNSECRDTVYNVALPRSRRQVHLVIDAVSQIVDRDRHHKYDGPNGFCTS